MGGYLVVEITQLLILLAGLGSVLCVAAWIADYVLPRLSRRFQNPAAGDK